MKKNSKMDTNNHINFTGRKDVLRNLRQALIKSKETASFIYSINNPEKANNVSYTLTQMRTAMRKAVKDTAFSDVVSKTLLEVRKEPDIFRPFPHLKDISNESDYYTHSSLEVKEKGFGIFADELIKAVNDAKKVGDKPSQVTSGKLGRFLSVLRPEVLSNDFEMLMSRGDTGRIPIQKRLIARVNRFERRLDGKITDVKNKLGFNGNA